MPIENSGILYMQLAKIKGNRMSKLLSNVQYEMHVKSQPLIES
jgi:hypothetical protein